MTPEGTFLSELAISLPERGAIILRLLIKHGA